MYMHTAAIYHHYDYPSSSISNESQYPQQANLETFVSNTEPLHALSVYKGLEHMHTRKL